MREDHSIRDWILIFLLAAAFPIFVHVVLVEVVSVTTTPLAKAVLASEAFTDRDSFTGALRVLNGLLLGLLIAIAFGVPLAFALKRQPWVRCVIFVLAVLVASAIWHFLRQSGIDTYVHAWRIPEMWLSVLASCAVAILVSKARSRRKSNHVAA
jgi:predicted outer membrane lipoprotein